MITFLNVVAIAAAVVGAGVLLVFSYLIVPALAAITLGGSTGDNAFDQTIVNGISRIGYMTGGKAALWKDEDMADVFTRKATTDVSYLACARRLLDGGDVFYPQFATHNAHTIASIIELAGARRDLEFQRLHGMVVSCRVSPVHQTLGDPFGLTGADVVGFQDRAHRALRHG